MINGLELNYKESFASSATLAPELGYQINLRLASGSGVGENSAAFFDLNGRELTARNGRFGGRLGNRRVGRRGQGLRDCIDFVFPITLTMPDGSALTLDSATRWAGVREWYQNSTVHEKIDSL